MDCNLCGNINNKEDYYYCDVDKNGVRLDINEKKELCCGLYEFVASTKFYQKDKVYCEVSFYFIFETSIGAIDSGFLYACIKSVKDAINNEIFYNGNNVKIGIITYNNWFLFF